MSETDAPATEVAAWTIQRLLQWTTQYFQQKKCDAPRLAAEVLLAEALGCPRIQLYARFAEVPVDPALSRFRDWVKRHAAGEPVAYLVGYRDFYAHRFKVSPAVLIPRPETEQLVVQAIDIINRHQWQSERVVDVGTGSGCIALTLAKQFPTLEVSAIDLSAEALAVASQNAETLGVQDRVTFLESDLLAALPAGQRYPLIVSNPPYVADADQEHLEENVRRYEPNSALFGGATGLEITERLIAQSIQFLQPGGYLILETSPMLADAVQSLLLASAEFTDCSITKDLAGLPRTVQARKKLAD